MPETPAMPPLNQSADGPSGTGGSTGTLTPEAVAKLCARLRNTPNWLRQDFGNWKDATSHYDRTPFEAATMLESLSRALAERDALAEHWNAKAHTWAEQADENIAGWTRAYNEAKAELAAARKVPREPIEPMIEAGRAWAMDAIGTRDYDVVKLWQAMYDAAQAHGERREG